MVLWLFDVEFISGVFTTAKTRELGHDVGENWEIGRVWIHGYWRFLIGDYLLKLGNWEGLSVF